MRVVDHGCLGQTGCYQNWPGLRPFANDTDLGMATTTTSFYWHDYNSALRYCKSYFNFYQLRIDLLFNLLNIYDEITDLCGEAKRLRQLK